MIEDNFNSMVIMECHGDLMECIHYKGESYLDLCLKKGNIIYRNFNIDFSDKCELIDMTISWKEENHGKDRIISNINAREEKFLLEEHINESKLCKIKIWRFHPDSRFVFIFFQNTNLIKSSEVIKNFFGELNLRRISLSNSFFDNLINSNHGISLIGKTISIGFNYGNFNKALLSENEEQITEVKFIVNLRRNINVKINNKGMVKILNKPRYEEAYEIVEIINNILFKADSLGELYSE